MVPVHPGSVLREELEARSLSANAVARALRVSSGRIVDILNGKRAISADTALRLGKYFGVSPEIWLELQSEYELRVARLTTWKQVELQVRTRVA